MTENEIKALIEKYLKGTINKDEERLLEQFDKNIIERYAPRLTQVPETQKKAQQHLASVIGGSRKRRPILKMGLRIAASVLLLLCIGYLGIEGTQESPKEVVPVVLLTKQTNWGQKISMVLPDGSSVKLNSGSTLTFPESFNDSTREVVLDGEAFFDVVKNPKKPFVIKSGELKTTVLGTSFNVNAYKGEQIMAVTVLSGEVGVNTASGQLQLLPNEQCIFDINTKQLVKEHVNAKEILLWKDGILKFNDAGLGQVAEALER
ncbi:MAG: FecR domain-containing protein, partial [Bacteroidota bacterium]